MPEENNLEENIISALKLKNLPDNCTAVGIPARVVDNPSGDGSGI